MKDWKNNGKSIALLLGCTIHKPYSTSFIHKKIIGLIRKHELDDKVQQFIIGEPLVVCPREWETIYPAAHYEFPPEKLGEEGRKIFTIRLRDFFEKYHDNYHNFIVFAPNHHRKIITDACNGLITPIVIPYNIYNLPKLLCVIKNCIGKNSYLNAQTPKGREMNNINRRKKPFRYDSMPPLAACFSPSGFGLIHNRKNK
jgi:hypothetical protein